MNNESAYREERAALRKRVQNADSGAERHDAILRIAEINREIHAETYAKLVRE